MRSSPNAGVFISKPFTEYTGEDFQKIMSVNVDGFLYIAQLAAEQMLTQKIGGSITAMTTVLVETPINGFPASVQMIAMGGLEVMIRGLAIEYAKESIRFNSIAPGFVDTPLTSGFPRNYLKTLSPWE